MAFFGILLARYFLLAGAIHWFLYGTFGSFDTGSYLKSSQTKTDLPPKNWLLWSSIKQDIKLSIISSIVFALFAASVLTAYQAGITSLYVDIHQYPLWYLGVSYIAVIILQDTYFYFLHRLLHHPRLFRWWHRGHHRSSQPTPWTSFAFDLPESIAHALFLVGLIFLIPLHFVTVIAVLSTMTAWAVVNHLGIDRLPSNFPISGVVIGLPGQLITPFTTDNMHCTTDYILHFGTDGWVLNLFTMIGNLFLYQLKEKMLNSYKSTYPDRQMCLLTKPNMLITA
jgi:Delta7-sterol 5-desaturase